MNGHLNCRNPAGENIRNGRSDADKGDGVDRVLEVDEAAEVTGHVSGDGRDETNARDRDEEARIASEEIWNRKTAREPIRKCSFRNCTG